MQQQKMTPPPVATRPSKGRGGLEEESINTNPGLICDFLLRQAPLAKKLTTAGGISANCPPSGHPTPAGAAVTLEGQVWNTL